MVMVFNWQVGMHMRVQGFENIGSLRETSHDNIEQLLPSQEDIRGMLNMEHPAAMQRLEQ